MRGTRKQRRHSKTYCPVCCKKEAHKTCRLGYLKSNDLVYASKRKPLAGLFLFRQMIPAVVVLLQSHPFR